FHGEVETEPSFHSVYFVTNRTVGIIHLCHLPSSRDHVYNVVRGVCGIGSWSRPLCGDYRRTHHRYFNDCGDNVAKCFGAEGGVFTITGDWLEKCTCSEANISGGCV